MKRFLLYAILLVLLSSCDREPTDQTIYYPPVINPPNVEVAAGLIGVITSGNNVPVQDAVVSIKGQETTTDGSGKFSFENATLYKDGTYIEITKPGFFKGSRKIYALASETNVMEVELMALGDGVSSMPDQEFEVETELLKMYFPSGQYKIGSDDFYEGELKVHLATIPSNLKNSYLKIPGDLTGVDYAYRVKALSNFGVFNVSVFGSQNQELGLPVESKGQFEYELVGIDLNLLPAVVSLYHFDESNGTWVERSEAKLSGNVLQGEIDAFGYWMFGESFLYADIKGSLAVEGSSFPDTRLEINNRESSYSSIIHSTPSGRYAARVPQEIPLNLSIFHSCAAGNQTEELGVLNQDKTIDLINIETDMENVLIEGSVKDCYGEVQSSSFVKVSFSNQQFLYRADNEGKFNHTFSNCSDIEVTITAINVEEQKISEILNLGIANHIYTGEISTCNEVVAGYEISYDFMDWQNELQNSVEHVWEISKISGSEPRIIFSTKMIDEITGEVYLKAAFVVKEGQALVDYQLTFNTQAFNVFGKCELQVEDHEGLLSYRFFGLGDDIESIDDNVFPGNIDTVNFNLVYYD